MAASTDYQFPTVRVPASFTPNVVIVTDIGLDASEKTVRDFFTFCGSIVQFEIVPTIEGLSQKAFIEFEKESAARTALLLSNAVIGGKQIRVAPYFEQIPPYSAAPPEEGADATAAAAGAASEESERRADAEGSGAGITQEDKPKTSIITEILAAGYVLTDQIIDSAKSFDDKHGITPKFHQTLEGVKTKGAELDEKYKIGETSKGYVKKAADVCTDIDQKYHVKEKADYVGQAAKSQALAIDEKYRVREQLQSAKTAATQLGQQAMQSEAGLKVSEFLSTTFARARAIHEEAKRTAAEREGKPWPPAPAAPAAAAAAAQATAPTAATTTTTSSAAAVTELAAEPIPTPDYDDVQSTTAAPPQ